MPRLSSPHLGPYIALTIPLCNVVAQARSVLLLGGTLQPFSYVKVRGHYLGPYSGPYLAPI